MTLELHPNIYFKASETHAEQSAKHQQTEANKVNTEIASDTFENEKKAEQENKKGLKHKLASIAKFFTSTEELTKGTAKGAIYGTLAGGSILGAGWLFGALPRGLKNTKTLVQTFKHPFQAISSKTKITAGLTAIGIAAYHIIRGKFQANLYNAFIDKKLNNN